jgi:DNA-binding PucR family transcriptional regulator
VDAGSTHDAGAGADSQPPPTKSAAACTGGEEEELDTEEEEELGPDEEAMAVRPRGGSEGGRRWRSRVLEGEKPLRRDAVVYMPTENGLSMALL